jgi:hypothetical protein
LPTHTLAEAARYDSNQGNAADSLPAHVLVGEPDSTSPEHALAIPQAATRHPENVSDRGFTSPGGGTNKRHRLWLLGWIF